MSNVRVVVPVSRADLTASSRDNQTSAPSGDVEKRREAGLSAAAISRATLRRGGE